MHVRSQFHLSRYVAAL